jgi:lipid A 3-O-deacylase
MTKRFKALTALAVLLFSSHCIASDLSVDSASLEVGGASQARMLRVAVQSNWERRWFQSNGTHVAGFWDLSLAQWRGSAHRGVPGDHLNITSIGLTPVFRLRADDGKGWFAEVGIGAHLLSERYHNATKDLSTAFQFGDHIGVGYVFNNGWEGNLKFQHFSNGGIKKPNDGVNFVLVQLAKPF